MGLAPLTHRIYLLLRLSNPAHPNTRRWMHPMTEPFGPWHTNTWRARLDALIGRTLWRLFGRRH